MGFRSGTDANSRQVGEAGRVRRDDDAIAGCGSRRDQQVELPSLPCGSPAVCDQPSVSTRDLEAVALDRQSLEYTLDEADTRRTPLIVGQLDADEKLRDGYGRDRHVVPGMSDLSKRLCTALDLDQNARVEDQSGQSRS